MAAPSARIYDTWLVIDFAAADPAAWIYDTWLGVNYGGLIGLLDYVVGQVVDVVGHGRVYNRHRHTRSRLEFETLFVDNAGLEFWTVRRTRTTSQRVGNENAKEQVHTILVEGLVRHQDADLDADATEYQLQERAESIADVLRPLVTLGGNAELSWLGNTTVEDVEYASVACHRAQVGLQAQIFATD